MKNLIRFLIIAGFIFALYSGAERIYSMYRYQVLLDNLAATLQKGDSGSPEKAAVPSWENAARVLFPDQVSAYQELSAASGILLAKKIGFMAPLLRGIDPETLKTGVGILEGSAEIGEAGNTILTAHKSNIHRRSFNRLPELQPGDRLDIVTYDACYQFEVFMVAVLDRQDISFLTGEGGENTLTLFTSHPFNHTNPPYRLVIRARLTDRH